ncbi:MAG: magnesium chelatase [Desulfurococcales archaeon ex4484_217_2]|nr:MAG: magnesium chelatase [Desulfurococcales archaeon ex4484_217_2]
MLIEGPPGTAKTLTAKLFAQTLGLSFKRIQMTPDMVPADIIGAKIIDPKTGELRTVLGPIFANIVLADEVNRASPRTQSALLEAMQEKQVTIEGETHKLPKPFTVIATQNPWETTGTFPLPETQLDRFGIAVTVDYPSFEEEIEIVMKDHELKAEEPVARRVVDEYELFQAFEEVAKVHVERKILEYIVSIVKITRSLDEVVIGASPRASIMMLRYSKAIAALRNRDYVIPDDVKYVAPYVLRHRIILKPSIYETYTPSEIFEIKNKLIKDRILGKIEVPW